MKSKPSLYWRFQLGGWGLYGLIMVSMAYLFQNQNNILYPRIVITMLCGFFLTHLFRKGVERFQLKPPLPFIRVFVLVIIILLLVVVFPLMDSMVAEWLKLYNPQAKVSIGKRFLANFLLNSPIMLIWVAIYYVWHYAQTQAETDNETRRLLDLIRNNGYYHHLSYEETPVNAGLDN